VLLRDVADRLRALTEVCELVVPYERGDVLASLHREGEVLVEAATDDGMRVRARLDDASATRWHEFVVE
jgi:GTP-binding protein HflX